MADMDIRVKVTGTLNKDDRQAMARFMAMEGEPMADVRAAFADWVANEAWQALASAIREDDEVDAYRRKWAGAY